MFGILSLRSGTKTIKEWYGCNVSDTLTLMDVYNEFVSGQLDHKAPAANHVSTITVRVGSSKHDLTMCDPSTRIGDVVSFVE